ncbi:MAG: GNAT family N-acetyltransferase [Deferribacterota bacterium]|nr:GNAT family N-acetyltransferase [Deferribacterota bacterium]
MRSNINIRYATEKDLGIILGFIRKIARYERLEKEVEATEESLKEAIFQKRYAKVIIAEYNKRDVAFAVFFYTFSTFTSRPTLYIEDIYVDEDCRRLGIGYEIFRFLAGLAKKENCSRMELSALKWNSPAINFYKKLGGTILSEWVQFRFDESVLNKLTENI